MEMTGADDISRCQDQQLVGGSGSSVYTVSLANRKVGGLKLIPLNKVINHAIMRWIDDKVD